MNLDRLQEDLIRDERNIPHAYPDARGYLTIGIGHLVDERLGAGLSPSVIQLQFRIDVNDAEADAVKYPWYGKLNDTRQNAILNMIFNLGADRFAQFTDMHAALAAGMFDHAAAAALDSLWARQVGDRARRVAELIRTGEYP